MHATFTRMHSCTVLYDYTSLQCLHAYPVPVYGAVAHYVDWTSGPDRYRVGREQSPLSGWNRQLSFYAYAGTYIHISF
jgi:hypothetical protein